jgi:1,4-dihydroxy-2-naphthoyl-CoA hydrolase
MFKTHFTIEKLRESDKGTMMEHLGIEYLEIGADFITARMPVDHRTRQPYGILHGGASVVLAESLGSVASVMCLEDPKLERPVGLEINANHLRSVAEGWVYGKVTPIHVGRRTHVWQIEITNEEGKKVCVSRLTVAIIK